MKVNKLTAAWYFIRSIAITLRYSIQVIIGSWFGKMSQQKIDDIGVRWSKGLLNVVHASYTIHGQKNLIHEKEIPIIYMCNHTSLYDIPLSFVALPGSVRMMAKKELHQLPIFGHTMAHAKFPSIDRKNRHQAVKDLQYAKAIMEEGISIWIAPEGTRSKTNVLQPFKKGGFVLAIETKAIVIPVNIQGAHNILPAKSISFSRGEHVDIYIGQPIFSKKYTKKNIQQFMQDVRKEMLNAADH